MKVTCTGRKVSLKPSFIEKAEAKLAKLDKFFPTEAQASVALSRKHGASRRRLR